MNLLMIDGVEFRVFSVATGHASLLLIIGGNGMLGCGYFNVETANKVGDALAVVNGVKSNDDMLNAVVTQVSSSAALLGVREGMSGRKALLLMA